MERVASKHPVDEVLPPGRLAVLGLQHVLVMYAGNVAVPLVVARTLHLEAGQTASFITADLFASGIATLVQTVGFWKFGARLPVMMGATFLSVGPMLAMAADPNVGLPGFYGALLVAGTVGVLITPLMGRVLALFPSVVTGSVITLLGLSLLSVGMNWAAGGSEAPEYGSPGVLGLALFTFLVTLFITKYGRGIWQSLAVLMGMAAGTLVALPLGAVHVRGWSESAWIAFVIPFRFGFPTFHATAILTLCIAMIVTLVESTGVFLALADITRKRYRSSDMVQALRADGLGIIAGAIFSAFAYTSFSQNVGLISVTRVRSRFVCAMGGAILILLGLLPKLARVVAAIPEPVLGGAGLVMFGMVAATGIRVLGSVNFTDRPHNLFIVASALSIGLIPTLSPRFFAHLPAWASPITGSGVVLGTLVAILLNLFLNGYERTRWDEGAKESEAATQVSQADR